LDLAYSRPRDPKTANGLRELRGIKSAGPFSRPTP
jgi:hypothetical protein